MQEAKKRREEWVEGAGKYARMQWKLAALAGGDSFVSVRALVFWGYHLLWRGDFDTAIDWLGSIMLWLGEASAEEMEAMAHEDTCDHPHDTSRFSPKDSEEAKQTLFAHHDIVQKKPSWLPDLETRRRNAARILPDPTIRTILCNMAVSYFVV